MELALHVGGHGWCEHCDRPLLHGALCHNQFCSPASRSRRKTLFPKSSRSLTATNNLPVNIESLLTSLQEGISFRGEIFLPQSAQTIKNRLAFERILPSTQHPVTLSQVFSIFHLLMGLKSEAFKICIFERTSKLELLCEQTYIHLLLHPSLTHHHTPVTEEHEKNSINLLYTASGIISCLR